MSVSESGRPLKAAVKQMRRQRGLTQHELARLAGVSRQSLNQIENGLAVPSTAIALRLGRALGCRIEELFALRESTGALRATIAEPLSAVRAPHSLRAVVGSVDGRWVAHRLNPQQHSRDLTCAADALLPAGAKGREAQLRPLVELDRLAENLLVAGCDPSLGLLADRAGRLLPGTRISWLTASSGAALGALARSEVHVAGAHLFDPESGEYNVPFVRRAFAGRAMVVVTVAQIEEGLAVAPGNPLRIRGVAQLARKGVRLINRDESAGARRLLDRLLQQEGIRPAELSGYARLAPGHLEAAQAIAHGTADAAIITCAAALALGLTFVPLASERFDVVVPKDWLGDPRVVRFLDALASQPFRRELASIGGYSSTRSGAIVAELN